MIDQTWTAGDRLPVSSAQVISGGTGNTVYPPGEYSLRMSAQAVGGSCTGTSLFREVHMTYILLGTAP